MYCTLCGYIFCPGAMISFLKYTVGKEARITYPCSLPVHISALCSASATEFSRRKSVVSHLTSAVRIAIKPCVPKMLPGWAGECGDSLRPGMASSGWNLITAGKLMLLSHSDVFRYTECAHQSLHSFTVKDYQNGICLWLSLMQMLM